MGAVGFTYEVPMDTDWTTVKTFTFGPAVLCGRCINWARISCCPGEMRIFFDGPVSMSSALVGSNTGPHYQSGITTGRFSIDTRRVVSEVRVESRNATAAEVNARFCGGANVEVKTCITFTDGCINDPCVCSGTCVGTSSYVDII